MWVIAWHAHGKFDVVEGEGDERGVPCGLHERAVCVVRKLLYVPSKSVQVKKRRR